MWEAREVARERFGHLHERVGRGAATLRGEEFSRSVTQPCRGALESAVELTINLVGSSEYVLRPGGFESGEDEVALEEGRRGIA